MKRLWFRRKLYGWGWYPSSWEGWTATVGYIVILGILSSSLNDSSEPQEVAFMFILPVFILTGLLILIAYKKGEKPRWQWGGKQLK